MTSVRLVISDLPKPGEFEWVEENPAYKNSHVNYLLTIGSHRFTVNRWPFWQGTYSVRSTLPESFFVPDNGFETPADAKNFIEKWLWEHTEKDNVGREENKSAYCPYCNLIQTEQSQYEFGLLGDESIEFTCQNCRKKFTITKNVTYTTSKPICVECGAKSAKEAESMCICNGDKDYCHGCDIWED